MLFRGGNTIKQLILSLLILQIFLVSCSSNQNQSSTLVWEENKLIAHAMGGVDGRTYSNSLEAFQQNYDKGLRLFEVDLSLTSDGKMVARHDWRDSLAEMFLQTSPNDATTPDEPWTYDYVMSQPLFAAYTPIDIDQIIQLMRENKDMYIVTDTKYFETDLVTQHFQMIVDAAEKDPKLLNRVIPQIYNQQMLFDIQSVYEFKDYIYTLYMSKDTEQEVIDFSSENSIKVVTMPEFKTNAEFVAALKEKGIFTFVHTINDIEKVNEYQKLGVHGFYTDFLTNDDLDS